MTETKVVITNNISGVIKEINDHIKERMADACVAVRLKAIDSMKEPKHGVVYTTYFFSAGGKVIPIGTRWKPHQASAPGEAPAIDTGELAQSINIRVSDDGGTGEVGTDKKHGLYMEYGTSRVAARPWLKPAFESSLDKIKEIFTAPME